MTDKDKKAARLAKERQDAVRLLGNKSPRLVDCYQGSLLQTASGREVLKDILMDTGVFEINLTPEGIDKRNYGMRLLLTCAGAHIRPEIVADIIPAFLEALNKQSELTLSADRLKDRKERGQ